ncbi:hypothetical protein GA0074694_6177 [Micromonospora inyonensis]|uniref:Flavin reductase n=2 Tax=Micromonospora inyonensis TaxID=47866 RepID=A0A1C6SSJ0_9ACTN|nr:hypothetical protein GA0074694_6177 [Micromonospora inyonensis]
MAVSGVSLADLRRHVAARPTWRCRVCAAPWPCQPAKLGLRTEYADNRIALTLHLSALLYDAIADRIDTGSPDAGRDALFARFVGWTRVR